MICQYKIRRKLQIQYKQFELRVKNEKTMAKRSRPPQGFYKSIETPSIPRGRKVCERKPEVLGTYEAERIMAKKFLNGRPFYMVKWHGYCASQNTWEPKDHLPADLVEAFENPDPDPDPVRISKTNQTTFRLAGISDDNALASTDCLQNLAVTLKSSLFRQLFIF